MTRWKAIPGYEGSYEVSDDGQVRSVGKYVRCGRGEGYLRHYPPRLRSLYIDNAGYARITFKRNKATRNHLIHHLVLEAFVGPRPAGMECRHLNGMPDDNRLENLRWGTSSENSLDVVRHGHHPGASKTHCKRGHEFTPENTIPQGNGRGRACRTCNNERARAFYESHKGLRQPNNKDKTHCKRGHEFTPENTYRRKDGGRQCRTCTLEAGRARHGTG